MVDGLEQSTAPGRLLAYQPATDGQVGFVAAEAPDAYAETTAYRRSVLVVQTGDSSGYVVDLFEVEGGSTHDYLLHGSADRDSTLEALPRTEQAVDASEMGDSGAGRAAYAYLKEVRSCGLDGEARATFSTGENQLSVHLMGQEGMRLMTAEGPSIRRARDDDAHLDDYMYPVLCLRTSGGRSRFVSVMEAHTGDPSVRAVEVVAEDRAGIVLRIDEGDATRWIGIDGAGEGISAELPDGRAFRLNGRAGVALEWGQEIALQAVDVASLTVGEDRLERTRDYTGTITEVAGDISGHGHQAELVVDADLPEDGSLSGKVVYVRHPSGKETAYVMDRVKRDEGRTRVMLAGMPRFIWGRARVAEGGKGTFLSDVDQPKAPAYTGCRVTIGDGTWTIAEMEGNRRFVLEESADLTAAEGETFTVYSTARGDGFRIAV